MKKTNFFYPILAIFFGLAILLVSLMVAEPSVSFRNRSQLSQRRFYFGTEILPDHVAYPFLMLIDRLRLEMAPPLRRPQLQLEYAWQRLEDSRQLLAMNRHQLALETLNKSQRYWLSVQKQLRDIRELKPPVGSSAAQLQPQLETSSSAYFDAFLELREEFTQPQQRDLFDKLIQECQAS